MAKYLLLEINAQFVFYGKYFPIPKLLFNPVISGGVSDIRLSVSFSVVGDVYSRKNKILFQKKNTISYSII